MKIIGRTSDGFILQAEEDEVYKLIGFNSAYRGNEDGTKIKIGDDLQVAAMFDQLYGLFYTTNCIDLLKKKAQQLIGELEKHPAIPILESVKVGPDKPDDK